MRILFVCTGNTCRSPMAEALFSHEMARRFPKIPVTADSAGLMAFDGLPASGGAQAAMADAGLSLSDHRARALDGAMVEAADLILTMTAAHSEDLRLRFPEASGKCFAYADYLNRSTGSTGRPPFGDVSDPFGGDDGIYRVCAEQLRGMTGALADALAEQAGPDSGSDTGRDTGSGAGTDTGRGTGSRGGADTGPGTGSHGGSNTGSGRAAGSDVGTGDAPAPSI